MTRILPWWRGATLAFAVVLAACGASDDGDDNPDPEPGDTLRVEPPLARLEVINNQAVSQQFTATLVKQSGREYDVTDRVQWSVDDLLIGSFIDSTFTAAGGSSGVSGVHAHLEPLIGDAQVEVFVRGVRVGPGAPPNAPDLFATGTVDPNASPDMVYPPDQVIAPLNLGDLEVHWRDSYGHDLFELTLVSDHVDLRVYVGGGATGWAAFASNEFYAAAHGGTTLTVGLRALTVASPSTIGVATPREVHLTNTDLIGGLYYWASRSVGGSYGIFRHDFGSPGQPAEPFYTAADAGRCVACHTLSRDGTKMTIVYDGGDGTSTIVDVATRSPMVPAGQVYWNFATYSGDGNRLVTSRQGTLTLRDGSTAAAINNVPTGAFASHPDFSATGDKLVYAHVTQPSGGNDWHFAGGQIATISFNPAQDSWGSPQIVVTGGGNNYYPSFSPDGQWILFNRSSEDAYDDGTAELWVARADGTDARKLDLANIGPGLTNSWARWAPFDSTYGPAGSLESLYWITFSTKRDFGVRLVGVRRPQIWMTPFFPGRAAAASDPTAPSFRLPFQDIESNNHIAQWTETVVPIGRIGVSGQDQAAPPAPAAPAAAAR